MAKKKGTKNRGRQTKCPRSKKTLAQRKRRMKEREISGSKKVEGNSSTKDNSFFCSAFGCTEQFKIGSNIGFFKFPTDEIRRELWILRAVKRVNWSPSHTSVLCGKHFQTGKPSKSLAHPDYIPNIFAVTDSVAKHQSHSSAVQIEESQCVIRDTNESEDVHFDSQSSSSFPAVSEGNPPKDSDYPTVVPNLFTFTNSVEKQRCHSSTAQTEESQCVIYDKIEIEDVPIDSELSSSIDISEGNPPKDSDYPTVVPNLFTFTISVEKQRCHSGTAQTEESQCVIYDKIEIEDVPIDSELSSSIDISEGSKEDEISVLKLKLDQALTSICTLRKEKADILKKLTVLSAQQNIPRNFETVKEELSKLKKELQEAYKEISSLRSERIAWQDHITDRIFQDSFKLRFFTGLNSTNFLLLTKLLSDIDTTATCVPVSSQLMIVLMRLQLSLKYPDLADRFQTSVDTIRRICESVIPHLESKLKLFIEGLSPVSLGMQPVVSHCYTNKVLTKLYHTIQRYTKSKLYDEITNICTNKLLL